MYDKNQYLINNYVENIKALIFMATATKISASVRLPIRLSNSISYGSMIQIKEVLYNGLLRFYV